ncbi:carboxymuconolactone decarboxylase family protein [Methylocapsa acidiphila]|uniref:carboxymuconolactone decarboxylase family protein n=1 Tax=Methylocapsa acidiphila TaxID=133552 RepID=UPI000684350A|nr:carboxymuconolactone decarboxylase family protein [Methylocapsa acidiphila]
MRPAEIDPALASKGDFDRVTNGAARQIDQMREAAIFSDGALPARQKALAATLWAISARCEPCVKYYVDRSVRLGATEAEIGEILAVACVMGGCVGEMWAMKAYHAYKGRAEGPPQDADAPSCCSAH